ncbi:MAG: glycosyltransferase family 2 protein [Myxococcales bacterium]|nr:glycosyltransferase family 2 protein [Myxococcales bacterium]
MDLTFVVPALDEENSIGELYREIVTAGDAVVKSWELLFVDDGSSDGTARVIRELAEADDRVRLLQFKRNFGKSAAYSAAFKEARGELVVTMDADLQDDPAELPKLLETLQDGHDLVIGWKMRRLENEPTKTLPSRVFNLVSRMLFGIAFKDQNSGYRIMRRPVAAGLVLHGDHYRFIPQLAHLAGYRVGQIGVLHRKRKHGHSKYGVTRFWTGLLDLLTVRFLTRFRGRPLHFFGTVGLMPIVLGMGLEVYVLVMKALGETFQEHIAALIVGITLMLIGFQCIIIGLIGEMLSAPPTAPYLISENPPPNPRRIDQEA